MESGGNFAGRVSVFTVKQHDDGMKLEALPQTNNIKSIVTLEDKTDLERKGRQSEQGYLCVRFICFGNGNLCSLYDRSYGFFRRQIVLAVKGREPDREDDPFLGEKLIAEAEGILISNTHSYKPPFCERHRWGYETQPLRLSLITFICYTHLAGCRHTTEPEEVSGGAV